ncbi:hypothetical protein [Streptosporangium sandarakinum]|uniref:hypothetical protein n=1 Tax=Streptosporangium sandarakinum TaxID=1260955 RepID=UPI00343BB499
MALRGWLARGFWRLDAVMGGDAEPVRSQIFAARHPVKMGVRVGAAMGALFAVLLALSPEGWGWDAVGIPCAVIVFFGVFMTGMGFWERRRQRHYGFYKESGRTELGG